MNLAIFLLNNPQWFKTPPKKGGRFPRQPVRPVPGPEIASSRAAGVALGARRLVRLLGNVVYDTFFFFPFNLKKHLHVHMTGFALQSCHGRGRIVTANRVVVTRAQQTGFKYCSETHGFFQGTRPVKMARQQTLPRGATLLVKACLCVSACRFCVGDKFFLKNNMILCQMDYEEGQLNGSFETQLQ